MRNRLITLPLLILILAGFFESGLADSPLTSTKFSKAYLDVKIVEKAASQGVIDAEIAQFLSSSSNPVDVKAALINALSWDDKGKKNAAFYIEYLSKSYRESNEAKLADLLSADELLCLGYLKAMDDYFHPENAIPLLQQAKAKNPASFTVSLALALVEAEAVMGSDWCQVWRLAETVLNDESLQPDLRREAVEIVEKYMILYKEYCPPERASESAEVAGTDSCTNAQTQLELNECAKNEYEQADAELNRVYREVMAALRPELQEKLKTAQKAWINFRDTNCDCMAFDYSGGSIYTLVYYNCLRGMTKVRTGQIEELLQP